MSVRAAGLLLALAAPSTALAAEESGGIVDYIWQVAPILILLVVIGGALARLPHPEGITHSDDYRRRRVLNWLPLGLTYAFLYMGRYNLTVSKNEFADLDLMSNNDFGIIFGIGTVVYGAAFLLNGPLTDRYGGRKAILAGAGGSAIMNLLMALVTWEVVTTGSGTLTDAVTVVATPIFAVLASIRSVLGFQPMEDPSALLPAFCVLYAGNMYFQSFGAVAIVKVNAPWFHVNERGVFGAIFGILISLGVYFAYDWGGLIVDNFPTQYVFGVPAVLLTLFWVITFVVVRNAPSDAGFDDFETGDASDGDTGPQLSAFAVFRMMLTNRVILIIAFVEFCSGFLRQSIMQWYTIFAKQTGVYDGFVSQNWGLLLCCAGILGGVFAGVISDRVFQSRRGPVAAVLYAGMLLGAIAMVFLLDTPLLGGLVIVMSLCVIGVHGMLSGTASMDFGGKKNAGIAVGIIDGFVYLGTGTMAFLYGFRLPDGEAAADPNNWIEWPLWMILVSGIGFLLATLIWNAKPKPKAKKAA